MSINVYQTMRRQTSIFSIFSLLSLAGGTSMKGVECKRVKRSTFSKQTNTKMFKSALKVAWSQGEGARKVCVHVFEALTLKHQSRQH